MHVVMTSHIQKPAENLLGISWSPDGAVHKVLTLETPSKKKSMLCHFSVKIQMTTIFP